MTAAGASLTDGLNEEQQTAVFAPADRPLRIVAGAGTGKTETLARRVAHLVRNLGVPPDQILVLTFSNKAARELRERLSRDHILGAASAKRVCARTFHGFALALLRTHAAAAGLGDARFSVLGDSQQIALMRECVAENDASCAAAREAARTAARARHAGSFAVLGVAPDASRGEIVLAHRRLCGGGPRRDDDGTSQARMEAAATADVAFRTLLRDPQLLLLSVEEDDGDDDAPGDDGGEASESSAQSRSSRAASAAAARVPARARDAHAFVSRAKSKGILPALFSGEHRALYEGYLERLACARAVDFEDMIVCATRLLRGEPPPASARLFGGGGDDDNAVSANGDAAERGVARAAARAAARSAQSRWRYGGCRRCRRFGGYNDYAGGSA